MGMRGEVVVIQWECDSCGKVRSADAGAEPKGFHGEVAHVAKEPRQIENEEFQSWYACSPRCIGPAVKKMIGLESSGAPIQQDDDTDE